MHLIEPINADTLIYIGAGDLAADEVMIDAVKNHSYLIEADKGQAEELSLSYADNQKVVVLPLAIAKSVKSRTFYYQNLNEFNGFNIPPGLKTFYPGLKNISTEKIKTQSFDKFLKMLELPDSKNIYLVIDIATQIDELLAALMESEELYKIKRLIFTKSNMPLSKAEIAIEECIEKLSQKGFDLHTIGESQNSDFMRYEFSQNRLFLNNIKLQDELESQKKQAEEQKKTLQSQLESVKVQNNQLQEQLGQMHQKQNELLEALSIAGENQEALENTKENQLEQLTELNQHKNELKRDFEQQNQITQEKIQHLQNEINLEKQTILELNETKANIEQSLVDEKTLNLDLSNKLQMLHDEFDAVEVQKQEDDKNYEILVKKYKTHQTELEQSKNVQRSLEIELSKTQAQIEIIKELLIK
jgi:chromosome segregation ATPase